MNQSYYEFHKKKKIEDQSKREKNQSYTQFSKKMIIKNPISKYPELDRLPTESLIGIHEGLGRSVSLKRSKEKFLSDKRSGFQTTTEAYYRHLFRIDAIADHFLRTDGTIDLEKLIALVPEEGEEEEEEEGDHEEENDEDVYYEEDWDEDGYFEEDCDEDGDFDEDNYEDYDDNDSDEKEKKRNPFLLGKQFLLKFIEGGKIEADLKKASVEMAQWAIYNNCGLLADSILFLENCLFIDSNMLLNETILKISVKILEANNQQDTQVWKISSDADKDAGKVSFQHHSANSPYTYFLQDVPNHTLRGS